MILEEIFVISSKNTNMTEVITIYDSDDECHMDVDYSPDADYIPHIHRLYYLPIDLLFFVCEYYEVEATSDDVEVILLQQSIRTRGGASRDITDTYARITQSFLLSNKSILPKSVEHKILKEQALLASQMYLSEKTRSALRAYFKSFNTSKNVIWYAKYDKVQERPHFH
jgi:hypothetical protein